MGAVLEAIAPGQGEQFREILQGRTSDLEESKLITCMRNAIEQAESKRDVQQLLSIYCAKDDDGNYIFTKTQLRSFFPTVSINDIDKGRQRANTNMQGEIFLFCSLNKTCDLLSKPFLILIVTVQFKNH